jgi:2-oxoglutarate ferredoxin oxidoreductase subunit gamma
MRKEIRISGFGGQGVVLAGYILGRAFSLYANLEAVMTQSYGPEARGGASSTNIVVSDREIAYPFVEYPDILVALSQEAYTKFRPTAKDEALILIDEDLVEPLSGDSTYMIPATRLAENLGRRIVANMIMVGFFTSVTGLIERETMEESLKATVKPNTMVLNLEAFGIGFEYAHTHYELLTASPKNSTVSSS